MSGKPAARIRDDACREFAYACAVCNALERLTAQ